MKLVKKRSFKFIHSSDEIKAIFPLNSTTFLFDAQFYQPYMMNNKLSQSELQVFFQEISLALHRVAYYKSRASFLFLITFLFIFTIGLALTTSYFPHLKEVEESLPDNTRNIILFIVLLLMIIAGFFVHQYYKKKVRRTILSIIKNNAHYFIEKNLRWELPIGSIEYIVLYNLDSNLDTSFEFDPEDFEKSKTILNTRKLESSLLSNGEMETLGFI